MDCLRAIDALKAARVLSTAQVAYGWARDTGLLPADTPSLAPNAACSAFITNTSVALSLLLVFRCAAASRPCLATWLACRCMPRGCRVMLAPANRWVQGSPPC